MPPGAVCRMSYDRVWKLTSKEYEKVLVTKVVELVLQTPLELKQKLYA